MKWIRTPTGDAVALDGRTRYRVRAILCGSRWTFWVYVDGLRYTPTGHHNDAVSFSSRATAQRFLEALAAPACDCGATGCIHCDDAFHDDATT